MNKDSIAAVSDYAALAGKTWAQLAALGEVDVVEFLSGTEIGGGRFSWSTTRGGTTVLGARVPGSDDTSGTHGAMIRIVDQPAISVKQAGAIGAGNDTDNDSDAFSAAITAATMLGFGVVYVPAGTYFIKNVHLASGLTLELAPGAIVGSYEPTTESQVFYGENLSNVTIRGGIINGSPDVGSIQSGVCLVDLRTCTDVHIENVKFQNNKYLAIRSVAGTRIFVSGCVFDTVDSCFMTTAGSNTSVIRDCVCIGGTSEAISFFDGDEHGQNINYNVVIQNIICIGKNSTAVSLLNTQHFLVDGVLTINNTNGAVKCIDTSENPGTKNGIINNIVAYSSQGEARGDIWLNYATDVKVTNVKLYQSVVVGMYLVVCTDVVIDGFEIKNPGTYTSPTWGQNWGIHAQSGTNITIRNGYVIDTRETPLTQYGISNNSIISGLYIENVTATGATVADAYITYASTTGWSRNFKTAKTYTFPSGWICYPSDDHPDLVSFTAAATFSPHGAANDTYLISPSSPVTVSNITNHMYDGRMITLLFTNSNATFNNSGNMKLAQGAFSSAAYSSLQLVYNSTLGKLVETGRSANS